MGLRTRERYDVLPTEVLAELYTTFRNQYADRWSASSRTTGTGQSESAYVLTSDVVTPGYRKIRSSGGIINNAYSSQKVFLRPPQPVTYNARAISNVWDSSNGWHDIGVMEYGTIIPWQGQNPPALLWYDLPDWDEINAKVDLAVTKAHSSIDEAEILALATLAESSKTVDFLLDTSRRVLRIARAAKKLRLKQLRKEISWKEAQQRYMELRYAARPCVYDIVGVLKAVHNPLGYTRRTYRAHETGTITRSDQLTNYNLTGSLTVDLERTFSCSYSARAGVLCDFDRTWQQAVGLTSLPQTAWELLPFSFIVDWVANVGETIAAHVPKGSVRQLASWVVLRQEAASQVRVVEQRIRSDWATGYSDRFAAAGPITFGKREIVTRRLVNPPLRTWPQVDINLNMYKLLDLSIILKKVLR